MLLTIKIKLDNDLETETVDCLNQDEIICTFYELYRVIKDHVIKTESEVICYLPNDFLKIIYKDKKTKEILSDIEISDIEI